jgi:hypothetical protein
VNELGIVFERHVQVLLGCDLRLSSHCRLEIGKKKPWR